MGWNQHPAVALVNTDLCKSKAKLRQTKQAEGGRHQGLEYEQAEEGGHQGVEYEQAEGGKQIEEVCLRTVCLAPPHSSNHVILHYSANG